MRELCRFTTHTPVEAGHDRFSYDLVERLFRSATYGSRPASLTEKPVSAADRLGPIDFATLKALAGSERLNMTRLALNLSEFVNGVAKRHAELSASLYPGYQVRACRFPMDGGSRAASRE